MLRSVTSICLAVLILGSAILGGGTYSAAWAAHPDGQETVVMSESMNAQTDPSPQSTASVYGEPSTDGGRSKRRY